MKLGVVYEITLGCHSDKYLCVAVDATRFVAIGTELRRVRSPKSKIDGIRLPERISIREFSKTLVDSKSKSSKPVKK